MNPALKQQGKGFLIMLSIFAFVFSLSGAMTLLAVAQLTFLNVVFIVLLLIVAAFSVRTILWLNGWSVSLIIEKLELSKKDLLWLIIPSVVFIFFYFFSGAKDAAAASLLTLFCQIMLRLMRKGMRDWKAKYWKKNRGKPPSNGDSGSF